jgi:hypothetical protein
MALLCLVNHTPAQHRVAFHANLRCNGEECVCVSGGGGEGRGVI